MPTESCLVKAMTQGAWFRRSHHSGGRTVDQVREKKMKDRKVTRFDSLSPATNDFEYYGRIQHDIHFNVTDVFNTIVVLVFLALLTVYSTVL
jgi:hypothetical protein